MVQVCDSATIDPDQLIQELDGVYEQMEEIEVDNTDVASILSENHCGPSRSGTTAEVESTRVSENDNDEVPNAGGSFSDVLSGGRDDRSNVRKRRVNQSGSLATLVDLQEKRIKLEEVKMEQEADLRKMEIEQKIKIREMEIKSNETIELARIKAEYEMKEKIKMFELQMNVPQE